MTTEPPEWIKAPDHPDDWSARIVRQSPATDVPGIVAFIEARCDEVEKREHSKVQVIPGSRVADWRTVGLVDDGPLEIEIKRSAQSIRWERMTMAQYKAEFCEPAPDEYLLAITAMRRAILALHRPEYIEDLHPDFAACVVCDDGSDNPGYPCQTVRLLAAIDADHPDYDPSWKPVAT